MTKHSILLIDDDIEDFVILKQAFADLGAEDILAYVHSGPAAIDFLEKQYETRKEVPDIVVLDINMPIMSGPALLKIMRRDERFARIPVVMYSTSINPSDEEQCSELGVEYCISKPGTLDEIVQVGETLLALCHQRDPLTVPDMN
jgi:CheY-like chemotaxis protein